jgi:hypothetical protein
MGAKTGGEILNLVFELHMVDSIPEVAGHGIGRAKAKKTLQVQMD